MCDHHLFGQVFISKAICLLETITQSNFIRVLFLHYPAINWAEDISDLQLSATCAWGFCATKVKPLLPYMLQLNNTFFGFRLCNSSGPSIPEMKDPPLLSPSAQELSEASPAAKNTVPNNSDDRSAGCHCPSLRTPPSQPQPPSPAPSLPPKVVLLQQTGSKNWFV